MNTRSILTIGIVLVCFYYVLGDAYTVLDYYELKDMEENPISNYGVTPLMFYSFLILFILKVALLLRASAIAKYLLPDEQEIIAGLQMSNVLLVICILVCITTIPNLIMSIAELNAQVKYLDDPYKSFNAKSSIYRNAIELGLALAVMYWRNDLLKMFQTDKEVQ